VFQCFLSWIEIAKAKRFFYETDLRMFHLYSSNPEKQLALLRFRGTLHSEIAVLPFHAAANWRRK